MRRLLPVLAALVLSGCSSIPSSGPIVQGDRVDIAANDVNVRVIARPPSKGMGPEALVRGFLAACASVADGDDTARRYLTPAASAQWNPQRLAVVYDLAALRIVAEQNDTVRVSAPLLGSIDARDRFSVAEPGATISDALTLVQQDGEWRISQAPPALYLAESDVTRSYRAHAVYFLDAQQGRLVPEFVLVPISADSVPRELVRALLAGPRTMEGIATAIPSGTALMPGSMTQDFGAVTVSLTRAALQAQGSDRQAMLAQFAWTLTQLPSVGSVRVAVEGEALSDIEDRVVFTASDFASFDPSGPSGARPLLYVTKNDVLALLEGERTTLATGMGAAESASSRDRSFAVVVSATRRFIFGLRGASPWVVASGGDLASPQVTRDNALWYLDREASGGLFVRDFSGIAQRVRTGLAARAYIVDFSVAPDGVRIAVIVNDGTATTLRVGRVVRDAKGIAITGLARVEQRLSSVTAVAWASESQIAVLGTVGAVAVQAIRVDLPLGAVSLLGGPANAVGIAATPGQPVVVGDQSGQLWQLLGDKWTSSETGASPHYAM